MAKTPGKSHENNEAGRPTMTPALSELDTWFVAEILPLEPALMKFLRRSWRNESDLKDLCQDVFVEVYSSAQTERPASARAFTFAIARNKLVDRIRREQIVSIDAVADLETLGLQSDEPGPDRTIMARQDIRRLEAALARMPEPWRQAVIMRKIKGLTPGEIALRLGIAERTAFAHLASGLAMLTDLFQEDLTDRGGKK